MKYLYRLLICLMASLLFVSQVFAAETAEDLAMQEAIKRRADLVAIRQIVEKAENAYKAGRFNEASENIFLISLPSTQNDEVKALHAHIENLKKNLERKGITAANPVQREMQKELASAWNTEALTSSTSLPLENKRKEVSSFEKKLNQFVFPELAFREASLKDIVTFLHQKSCAIDLQGTGIDLFLETGIEPRPVTLDLRSISAYNAIRYIAKLAGVHYRIDGDTVWFTSPESANAALETRSYKVRKTFIASEPASPNGPEKNAIINARHQLEAMGVHFLEGATAVYLPATDMVTVRNTADQLQYIEQLIQNDLAQQGVVKMIKIETRALEINQTDLEDIAANWAIRGVSLPGGVYPSGSSGSQFNFSTTQAQTRLGTANQLPISSLDSLVGTKAVDPNGANISSNTLNVTGFLDGTAFTAMINALSQKKSFNLMSAPTIVVNSGSPNALIEVVREFTYPTAFRPPEIKLPRRNLSTDSNGNSVVTVAGPPSPIVVPAWPAQFTEKPRKVGIRIHVKKAQADEANRTVALELEPEITDFDGFIDYGSRIYTVVGFQGEAITSTAADGTPRRLLSENRIRVPIFSVRAFDGGLKLDVQDGYTMMLGGLIREEVQTLNDKVPILGDIPLMGQLFRSKSERAIRKNTILFVTPRILQPGGEPVNPDKKIDMASVDKS